MRQKTGTNSPNAARSNQLANTLLTNFEIVTPDKEHRETDKHKRSQQTQKQPN